AYCVVEGEFTSGHVLMFARSPQGETNIGIGIPGADLPKGGEWPVTIEVDKKLKRERVAVASQPDMLVVSNGKDDPRAGRPASRHRRRAPRTRTGW
uniref:hypothetical protein n=1 Tax=Methylobacterium sp. B34 TaxID=95563 RepID=UPI0019552B19